MESKTGTWTDKTGLAKMLKGGVIMDVVNAEQANVARAYIAQLTAAHTYSAPIVTRVDMLTRFWPAEDYHQNYLSLHPDQPYIAYHAMPKACKIRDKHPELVR